MSNEDTINSCEPKCNRDPDTGEDSLVGLGGELHQIAGGAHPRLTTNQGVAVSDNQNSLKANPRGPTLLEDFILREKINTSITSVFLSVSFMPEQQGCMDTSN